MADELVTVLYKGPLEILPVRDNVTKDFHNFLKGKTLDVPKEVADYVMTLNSRGFTNPEDARPYDQHVFEIVTKGGAGRASKDLGTG